MTLVPTGLPLRRDELVASGRVRAAAPPRIVHLGIGAFHRSHQAWYTAHADDAASWGIAGFTGRSARVAEELSAQGGVFTLVERGPDADRFELVDSISEAHDARSPRLGILLADPATAIVTLTITEAGYCLDLQGELDVDHPDIAADLVTLRSGDVSSGLRTPLARLVAALHERQSRDLPAVAVVPCDNLPDNGGTMRRSVERLASECGWDAASWRVSYVSTSVDRITPQTTPDDLAAIAEATGLHDDAAVVAEPFADWVLSGDFPAGRPAWESAGARFVDDITVFERRKLLMLNGGHLALAYTGLARGHRTIDRALADPECRRVLDGFWDEVERALGPAADAAAYRLALIERFSNGRIAHRLDQIASDDAIKVRLRIRPVVESEMSAGRTGAGALAVVRALGALQRIGAPVSTDSEHRLLAAITSGAAPEVADSISKDYRRS